MAASLNESTHESSKAPNSFNSSINAEYDSFILGGFLLAPAVEEAEVGAGAGLGALVWDGGGLGFGFVTGSLLRIRTEAGICGSESSGRMQHIMTSIAGHSKSDSNKDPSKPQEQP